MKLNDNHVILKVGIIDQQQHSYPNKICIYTELETIYIYFIDYKVGMTDLEALIVNYPHTPDSRIWSMMSTYKNTNKKRLVYHIVDEYFPTHYSKYNIFIHSFKEAQDDITRHLS